MEYLLLMYEFFYTKKWKSIFIIVLIPILIGLLINIQLKGNANYEKDASSYISSIISVLGVLIGFCISILTILLSIDNPNISIAKSKNTKFVLYNKPVTLFDSILINLAYLIVLEGILLIANFIYPIFIDVKSDIGKLFFTLNISFTIHIIMVLMRCILDFYFVVSKRD
jgi:hypothetical protein